MSKPKKTTSTAANHRQPPTTQMVAEVVPSRCRCGSSRRSDYLTEYYRDYNAQGLPFIGIYYRTCKCLDCGQSRLDQERVYSKTTEGQSREGVE